MVTRPQTPSDGSQEQARRRPQEAGRLRSQWGRGSTRRRGWRRATRSPGAGGGWGSPGGSALPASSNKGGDPVTADAAHPPGGKVARGVQLKKGVLTLTSRSHPHGTRRAPRRAVSSVSSEAQLLVRRHLGPLSQHAERGARRGWDPVGVPSAAVTADGAPRSDAEDQSRGRPARTDAGRPHAQLRPEGLSRVPSQS